jgi:3-oxoacyl-(acyl-carrier-protein) synthase
MDDVPGPVPRTSVSSDKVGVYITGLGSISSLGHDYESVGRAYRERGTRIEVREMGRGRWPGAWLKPGAEDRLEEFLREDDRYHELDRSVQFALYAARQAVRQAGWQRGQQVGVLVGSSRGATGLFERYHSEYLKDPHGVASSLSSPSTTLGNIATWVAQEILSDGPASGLSSTCSTATYALGSALAWLKAGMADRFLAGGAEAPLTPFTLAQMKALGVCARDLTTEFPCRPCAQDAGRENTMVLGEGACILALEPLDEQEIAQRRVRERAQQCEDALNVPAGSVLARVLGAGFCVEPIDTPTSLSEEGRSLFGAMQQALRQANLDRVDMIVTHTPGTALGDRAELRAIRDVFGSNPPALTSNKWILGHTLGAAGAFNIEYAIHLLRSLDAVPYPYLVPFEQRPCRPQTVLVNSVGFGGNAGSLVLEKAG